MVAWVGEDRRKVGYKGQFYSQSINHIREESLRKYIFYSTFERVFDFVMGKPNPKLDFLLNIISNWENKFNFMSK